jgi:hypothetical protein
MYPTAFNQSDGQWSVPLQAQIRMMRQGGGFVMEVYKRVLHVELTGVGSAGNVKSG